MADLEKKKPPNGRKSDIPEELKNVARQEDLAPLYEKLDELTKRTETLEAKIGTHEAIAKTMGDTMTESSTLKEKMAAIVLAAPELKTTIAETIPVEVKKDGPTKTEIVNLIDGTDREALKKLGKRFLTIVGWIISLIIAAIVGHYIHP